MIECIRDEKGNITAVCEWLLFNEKGLIDEKGETIFIGELEVNPEHRRNGCIGRFIKSIVFTKAAHAKRIFWFREYKYPDRGPRFYNVEQLKRRMR
jgi:hypothetical protein